MEQQTLDDLLAAGSITPDQHKGLTAETKPSVREYGVDVCLCANMLYKMIEPYENPVIVNQIAQEVCRKINQSYILRRDYVPLDAEDPNIMPVSNEVCKRLIEVADTPGSTYAVAGTFFQVIMERKGIQYQPPLRLTPLFSIPSPTSLLQRLYESVASLFH